MLTNCPNWNNLTMSARETRELPTLVPEITPARGGDQGKVTLTDRKLDLT